MMRAVNRKEAEKIADKLGLMLTVGDGRTFYATNEDETEIWEFNSAKERAESISRNNNYWNTYILEILVG